MNITQIKQVMGRLLLKVGKIPIWQFLLYFSKTLKKFLSSKPKQLCILFTILYLTGFARMFKNRAKKEKKAKLKSVKQVKHYESQCQEEQGEEESIYPKQHNRTRYGTDIETQKQAEENKMERKRDEIFFSIMRQYGEEDFVEDVSYRAESQASSSCFPEQQLKLVPQTQPSNYLEDEEDYWEYPNQICRQIERK